MATFTTRFEFNDFVAFIEPGDKKYALGFSPDIRHGRVVGFKFTEGRMWYLILDPEYLCVYEVPDENVPNSLVAETALSLKDPVIPEIE